PVTMPAHPGFALCRDAQHQRIVGHIAAHHCARADECVTANARAANDCAIGAERCAAPHNRPQILAVPIDLGSRVNDISENAGRSAEDVVFQLDSGVNRNVILNLAVIANHHVVGDIYVLAQNAALAEAGSRLHVGKMPNLCAGSDLYGIVDVGTFVHEIISLGHEETATPFSPAPDKVNGSPLLTSDFCAVCNTCKTRRPLFPSVKGGLRVWIDCRNAWHSNRSGSSFSNSTSSPAPLIGTGWPSCTSTL